MAEPDYLTRQRTFWKVARADEARFDRVDTRTDRTEESWQALVDIDAEHVFGDIRLPSEATVLELGCGIGRMLAKARQLFPTDVRLVGVDISESMIQFARQSTAGMSNVSLLVTDGSHLQMVADGSVDYAYSLHVFIHIADAVVVRSYLREFHRVLRRGARLRFNTRRLNLWDGFAWSPGGLAIRLAYLSGLRRSGQNQWRTGDPAEFNGFYWRPRDLRREVESAGFSVQRIDARYDAQELWCDAVKL
ncbi:MAG: methyltransferase domain-containing protein [Vicinamibacterales bacterium]